MKFLISSVLNARKKEKKNKENDVFGPFNKPKQASKHNRNTMKNPAMKVSRLVHHPEIGQC